MLKQYTKNRYIKVKNSLLELEKGVQGFKTRKAIF